ncbi:hypothetical protein TRVA0_002S04456 [Trichomonascus vanleenenianus]|uniref:Tim17/Tim22/Tim23/Pmp24 family protein n=1 Tax=Trichomonascus vanleenenianus TaxID=2268995 RepID=UPI003ECA643D
MELVEAVNRALADPKYHDVLSILKGTRNGIWYGAKLRFCHALVMSVLFRSGPLKSRWQGILKNTKQHAKALGTFVFIYKTIIVLLKHLRQNKMSVKTQIQTRSNGMDPFIAGLIGGYWVYGRNSKNAALSTINQQMVLYVFSRVVLGMGKKILEMTGPTAQQRSKVTQYSWVALSSLSWALVMNLFRTDTELLQSSMLHSMRYLYVDSESWNSLYDFVFR